MIIETKKRFYQGGSCNNCVISIDIFVDGILCRKEVIIAESVFPKEQKHLRDFYDGVIDYAQLQSRLVTERAEDNSPQRKRIGRIVGY